VTGKVPYLKEDGALGFTSGEEETKDPVYTPMGVFITSWARYTTITTAQKCYDRILYCDTDSIHILGTDIPEVIADLIDPKKLGYWKHESTFKRAKFVKQKTYVEDIYGKMVWDDEEQMEVFEECEPSEATTTKLNVKCAGMSEKAKANVTFENFDVGLTVKGNLKPKQVPGGVVLLDDEFTIKGDKKHQEIPELSEEQMRSLFEEWENEYEIDLIKEGVEQFGYIQIIGKGQRHYGEYVQFSMSCKRKYFRKSGVPLDVFASLLEIDESELIEKLHEV
jgi:hypothetical protein